MDSVSGNQSETVILETSSVFDTPLGMWRKSRRQSLVDKEAKPTFKTGGKSTNLIHVNLEIMSNQLSN